MRAEAYKTLATLELVPETYLVEHDKDTYVIANGQGFSGLVQAKTALWLMKKGYVAKRYHPRYYFITEAGRKKL